MLGKRLSFPKKRAVICLVRGVIIAAGTRFVVPPDMSAARRPSLTSLSNSCKASQSVMIHVANVPNVIGARKFGINFFYDRSSKQAKCPCLCTPWGMGNAPVVQTIKLFFQFGIPQFYRNSGQKVHPKILERNLIPPYPLRTPGKPPLPSPAGPSPHSNSEDLIHGFLSITQLPLL